MLLLDYPEWSNFNINDYMFVMNMVKLTPELQGMSDLLDDESFEEPILKKFNTRRGRPSVPLRVYTRMMVLKFFLGLSYENLTPVITRTPMYKIFCHIPMDQDVPTPTALMKITKKYGEDSIQEINESLVVKLKELKLVKGNRIRVDSTVVEGNICHPTDAGLLFEGVRRIHEAVSRCRKFCGETVRRTNKVVSEQKKKLLSISKVARRRSEEKVSEVRKIVQEMAQCAKQEISKAKKQLGKFRAENKREQQLLNNIHSTCSKLETVIEQAESIDKGEVNIKGRLVSYHDPDVHPIKKGKLGKQIQFGMISQIEEAENGIIAGYQVYKGNPSDKTLMPDAMESHKKVFGKAPREVTADRGYYTSKLDGDLHKMGVKHVCVPKIGRKSKVREAQENTLKFKELKSWRAGIEARISCLKRSFGFSRSMLRGISGAKTWCGYGIFAHNLRQAARLMISS